MIDIRKVDMVAGVYNGTPIHELPVDVRLDIVLEVTKQVGFLACDIWNDQMIERIVLTDDQRAALEPELLRHGYTDRDVWMMKHGVTRAEAGLGTGKGDGDIDKWDAVELHMMRDLYGLHGFRKVMPSCGREPLTGAPL